MKRLTALFLSALFLFNIAGYRLFFRYVQEQADTRYERLIDKNKYDESQMITLKVDLDMPYLSENTSFERVDGEITIDGKLYKYVKRKIHNGQLVLVCLPDEHKTQLRSSREEYFFLANSLASHSDSKQSAKSINTKLITDYDQHSFTLHIDHSTLITPFRAATNISIPLSLQQAPPALPPEVDC